MNAEVLTLLDDVYAALICDGNISETIIDKVSEAIKLLEHDSSGDVEDEFTRDDFYYNDEDSES